MTPATFDMAQAGVVAGLFLIACAIVSWWLYHRESALARERIQAEHRAQRLIEEVLPFEQREQLRSLGFIELKSQLVRGRTYRVPRRRGQVQVYDDGRHAGSLCIQPLKWVPDGDVVLMHKLMIEASESEYLRTANFFKPYRVG